MAHGWAYRHFILLFFIMMLAAIVVVFMNVAHESPPEKHIEYPTASGTTNTSPETVVEITPENQDYVTDKLVKQNIHLRSELDKERYRCDLLEKNTSVQARIIEQQNGLIVKMHERLDSYMTAGTEVLSPSDWISDEQIKVTSDRVIIEVPFARTGTIMDTNSEKPFLNGKSNTIEIRPPKPERINLGDIIVYYSKNSKELIVHRVVAQGNDEEGWFVIAKGDNNFEPDPEKIRYDQIKSVVVGIIY